VKLQKMERGMVTIAKCCSDSDDLPSSIVGAIEAWASSKGRSR
jgi:hypothetical protein